VTGLTRPVDLSGGWSPRVRCPTCGAGTVALQDPRCSACGRTVNVEGRMLVLGDTPTDDYSTESSAAQAEVVAEHVWFQLRTAVVLDATRLLLRDDARRFIDFGCGNGYLMDALERQGWQTVGVDMHLEGLRRAQDSTRGVLLAGRIFSAKLVDGADAAGLFDVIEHAPDDLAVLQHVRDQLVPGGAVVVTVPAMRSLWSEFDVLLGHKRRYSRRALRNVIEQAGFTCEDVRYCFSFAVPAMWMHRRLRRGGRSSRRDYYIPPSPIVSRVARAFGWVERALHRRSLRSPFGSSLIAVGRRPMTQGSAGPITHVRAGAE
jgi:SAM-dependent methyltransferase